MSATPMDSIWGNRAKDWTEIQEKQGKDGYDFVLDHLQDKHPAKILDMGCGSGYFCQLAALQGFQIYGIDKTESLLNEAKIRIPDAHWILANMEELPFPDNTFDIVCGFNSFQYANDLLQALAEAKRVLKPSGLLAIMVWGNAAHCDVIALLDAFSLLVSSQTNSQHSPFALSENDILEQTLSLLKMEKYQTHIVASTWTYPNTDTALRGILSLGAASKAIEINGIEKVKDKILQLLPSYTNTDGTIIFHNQYKIILIEKV